MKYLFILLTFFIISCNSVENDSNVTEIDSIVSVEFINQLDSIDDYDIIDNDINTSINTNDTITEPIIENYEENNAITSNEEIKIDTIDY